MNIPKPSEEDVKMMIAATCHLGATNCNKRLEMYVWKRREDGVHIINLEKTWKKIILAARMIAGINDPEEVFVVSSRPYGQRAAHKFSYFLGSKAIVGRFVPGTFTNHVTKAFREPKLIVVADPHTDERAIVEASYMNIPCIAIADIDSKTSFIDCIIPANNKGKTAIGTIFYLLTREVMNARKSTSLTNPSTIMVDLFFYRDPEEEILQEEELISETKMEVTA